MVKPNNTRAKLIDTTMHLMWADGYNGVSVDRICQEAGVNKGSFYHFFPSKEALAIVTIEAIWEMAKENVYKTAFDPSLHPLERFNRFAEITYQFHVDCNIEQWSAEQGCPFGNIGAEVGHNNPAIRVAVEQAYQAEADYFEKTIAEGIAMGAIPARLEDATTLANRVVAMQTGLMTHAKVYNDTGWLLQWLPAIGAILGVEVGPDQRLMVPETAPT